MQNSTNERRKLIHEFLNFTGTSDEDKALSYLDTANWDLSEAVQLFYAQQLAAEPTDVGGSASAAAEEDKEDDEDVRPPLPSKYERLVDRDTQYDHLLHRRTKQKPIYEAFRNHTAELAEYEHGPNAQGGTTGLARLYKAPIEILYRKGFDDAKEKAAKEDTWLMVNIQSANEFASHELNRDTFSNNALKEMIKANFIFLQTYNDGITGQKLSSFYKLKSFPCVLVIDPITGELMRCFTGFVEANRLIEDLVEFMDCRPTDGTASRLVKRHHMVEKDTEAEQETIDIFTEDNANRKTEEDMLYTADDFLASDDEEVEQGQETTRRVPRSPIEVSSSPATEQPAVPPVPPAAGEDTCTVGILLPDGRRLQRRFYKHDTVEGLYGFCNSEFDEARLKPYKLKPRIPGFQFLENLADTLESAGVHDSLLTLVWDG